jgi:chromosome segregation ATPase
MSDSQMNLISRIGGWFKKSNRPEDNGLDNGDLPLSDGGGIHGGGQIVEARTSFLRPWAKRDAAIHNLQDGFSTLTDLMSSIKDNLERQNERQGELSRYLSSLPQVLEMMPESNRMQGEALKAIHQQLASHTAQQEKLSDILNRLNDTGGEQREMLEQLQQRVETVNQNDQSLAEHLQNVGLAMQSVSKNSSTSTQVLENMRDNINSRDGQLERILHKQNTRFTTMLAVAIFISVAALAAVCVMGYLLVVKK